MLDPAWFMSLLRKAGINFFSCVPCSFIAPLINEAIKEEHFIMAHNEGDAAAVCAGAYLANRVPLLLCQNSGLTNALSPLVSLHQPFAIPLIALVGFRGEPGKNDEVHHEIIGSIYHDLLESIGIKSEILSDNENEADKQIKHAIKSFNNHISTFFAVRKSTFQSSQSSQLGNKLSKYIHVKSIKKPRVTYEQIPERIAAIKTLREHSTYHDAYLATTGFTSRELFSLGDDIANFYMVGSMGCVSSIALGVSMFAQNKFITILDGDAALLMRLSSMALLGHYGKNKLFHIVLDNQCHASTGGQPSGSESIDFVSLAHAVGYHQSIYIHNLQELNYVYQDWHENPQLTFAYLRVDSTITTSHRPLLSPRENAIRFSRFLATDSLFFAADKKVASRQL